VSKATTFLNTHCTINKEPLVRYKHSAKDKQVLGQDLNGVVVAMEGVSVAIVPKSREKGRLILPLLM
jgi:hypothetical protein